MTPVTYAMGSGIPMEDVAFRNMALRALQSGGKLVSATRIEWDIAGRCSEPVGRDITLKAVGESRRFRDWQSKAAYSRQAGVSYLMKPVLSKVLPKGFTVSLTVRCRRCEQCRRQRRMLWADRARRETLYSPRTWFGTLTLHPDAQFLVLERARRKMNRQGIDFDKLSGPEQFRLRVQAASPWITLYIKRVRKECAAPLRYLWVSEAHKSGSPHFHALVHEVLPDSVVTHACLSGQWPHGFTKWKLVRSLDQSTYLTKYLSKSADSRVRASKLYGMTSSDIATNSNLLREGKTPSADPPEGQTVCPTGDNHEGIF